MLVEFELRIIADHNFDAERLRAGLNDFNRLRMAIVRDEETCFRSARTAWQSVIASAAAVASSSSDALAMSSAVRSVIMVWKFNSASSRPWAISAW